MYISPWTSFVQVAGFAGLVRGEGLEGREPQLTHGLVPSKVHVLRHPHQWPHGGVYEVQQGEALLAS
jgi:hypothetical protein